MDPRSVQLEEKVAHLERYVADLDGVVRGMHERMDHFAREAKVLRSIIDAAREGEGTPGDGPVDERPPHW